MTVCFVCIMCRSNIRNDNVELTEFISDFSGMECGIFPSRVCRVYCVIALLMVHFTMRSLTQSAVHLRASRNADDHFWLCFGNRFRNLRFAILAIAQSRNCEFSWCFGAPTAGIVGMVA